MEIVVLIALVGSMLLTGVGQTYGRAKTEPTSQAPSEDDPRSPKAILEKIYGPPIGTKYAENRASRRASSTQYPMVAAILALKYNPEKNTEDAWSEDFKAGGVIVTQWVVISACSYFFVSDGAGGLIKIEDDPHRDEKELKYQVLNYLVRAGHFSVPNVTGITSTSSPQSIPIENMTAHPKCGESLNTKRQLYDTVALQLRTPLVFNEYVSAASFYSLDVEYMEDKLEEMQEVNSMCHLLVVGSVATHGDVLYTSTVQIVDEAECNSMMCMIGVDNGEACRKAYNFYEMGALCTLSSNGDVPCEIYGGVLICDRQVYGIAIADYCSVCAPHVIAKPTSIIQLTKMYLDEDSATDVTEDLRQAAQNLAPD